MKKIAYLLVFSLLVACSASKNAKKITPLGNWDYAITGTPEGDFSGVMSVTSGAQGYVAKLNARGNELPLEKFVYDEATKKLKGELDYAGTRVYFDATLVDDNINGSMSAGGTDFPFKATRKK